jgi:VWFA-related protein
MKLTRLAFSLTTLSVALTAQTPAQAPQTPATAAPRLLSLFFDLNSLDAAMLATAQESAIKFVRDQSTTADRLSVMTYTSKLNVLQDFTANHDSVLAALRMIVPADTGNNAAGNGVAGAEFTIFTVDRQLAALENAVQSLAALPDKKALIYFSNGVPRNGADNLAQLGATTNAAVRANVAIYSVDSRGLAAAPK